MTSDSAHCGDYLQTRFEQDSQGATSAVLECEPWILRSAATSTSSAIEVVVTKTPYCVGRSSDNDFAVANTSVSSRHAEFLFVGDGFWVRDVGSTNGTFLNGRRISSPQPLRDGDTLQFGTARFVVVRDLATPVSACTAMVDAAGDALANIQFETMLYERDFCPHFQHIVRIADGEHMGVEVLARSKLVGLQYPNAMFRLAEERGLAAELSSVLRTEGLRAGKVLCPQTQFYLNTHPSELGGSFLIDSLENLRNDFPDASIMLEIHEGAVTSSAFLRQLRSWLRGANIGLAYDDFGAGQARLSELADVPPDVIKFDMSLVHGISAASKERRAMVQALVQTALDLGVTPLAEGVEVADDLAACRDLGFELAQGYFYGRPAPASAWLKPSPQI